MERLRRGIASRKVARQPPPQRRLAAIPRARAVEGGGTKEPGACTETPRDAIDLVGHLPLGPARGPALIRLHLVADGVLHRAPFREAAKEETTQRQGLQRDAGMVSAPATFPLRFFVLFVCMLARFSDVPVRAE